MTSRTDETFRRQPQALTSTPLTWFPAFKLSNEALRSLCYGLLATHAVVVVDCRESAYQLD